MLTINDLRAGVYLTHHGDPYVVLKHSFIKMAQSKGIMRVTIKNLRNGRVLEETFKGQDKLAEADIKRSKATYLYAEGNNSYFMDAESYDQFFISAEQIGDRRQYLKEDLTVEVLIYNDQPISVELPKKISYRVTQAPPGIRGDTAQGSVMKQITLETGLQVNAPLFIKQGDTVEINTESGEYAGKA